MSSYRSDERDMRYPGPTESRYGRYPAPAGRGPVGTLAKWSLIGFNIIMAAFVLLPLIIVKTFENPTNAEVLAGYLGSALLVGSAFSFWVVANVILGMIVWLTKPR